MVAIDKFDCMCSETLFTISGSKETSLTNGSGGDLQLGQWSLQDSNTPSEMDHVVSDVQWSAVTTLEEEEQPLATRQAKTDQCKGVTVDQWKSCSICLEELADSELLVHRSCGATFCHSCLEVILH